MRSDKTIFKRDQSKQVERRNLTDERREYFCGTQYEFGKKLVEAPVGHDNAKHNQSRQNDGIEKQKSPTASKVAKEHSVIFTDD